MVLLLFTTVIDPFEQFDKEGSDDSRICKNVQMRISASHASGQETCEEGGASE